MIFFIVTIILSLDQITKFLASQKIAYNQSLPVIKGVFHLTLVHNRGAAFGILRNQVPIFIAASVFAIILILANLRNHKHGKLYSISLSLILAGALGNFIDRVFFGYVIDFLDFRIWPVFNLADSAITVGAVILGWSVLRERKVKA